MKRSPLRKASVERAEQLRAYSIIAPEWLEAHPKCQFPLCWRYSDGIHHKKGRQGELLCDTRWFMAVCDQHHKWIENHKKVSRQYGWILYK